MSFSCAHMTTLRKKRKLGAINRDNHEDQPMDNQARNRSTLRIQEVYFTQVSNEIEGRVTRKLSHQFSRSESRILVALSELNGFL